MGGQQVSDESLMVDVVADSREALSRLMHRHASGLLTFLVRMTADHHLAEEFFQDVFLAVWSHRGRFRSSGRFRPWLFGIAINKCRAGLRKRRRQPDRDPVSDASANVLPAQETGPVEAAVVVEQAATVQAAVLKLPENQRHVVVLRLWNAFSYSEIATTLDIAEATARSHMCLALSSLRDELGPRLR